MELETKNKEEIWEVEYRIANEGNQGTVVSKGRKGRTSKDQVIEL